MSFGKVDITTLEVVPPSAERIKIPRRKKPKKEAQVEQTGSIELARLTDPSVVIDDEANKIYSKFAEQGLDGKGGDNVTIYTVDWGDYDVEKIVELLVLLGGKLSGKTLFQYQKVHIRRIFRSVINIEGARLTTLYSRQSGKSEVTAIAVVTLCVAIPALAVQFPEQLGIFKYGFKVGLFAPTNDQSKLIYERVTSIAKSDTAKAIYEDPDIGTEMERFGCRWSNGSFVVRRTADPKANIEGLSLDLSVLDECQDIDEWVINKSILPMGAWNNATVVAIGTTNEKRSYFYNLIQANIASDIDKPPEERKHCEFDYRTVIKYNPRYAAFVEQEKRVNGIESPHFRMNFCLQWLFEAKNPISDSILKEYCIRPSVGLTLYTIKDPVVVGMDIGYKVNSTVVTVGKILKNVNIEYEDTTETKSVVQVCDWYELEGIDYPTQRSLIQSFLARYKNIVQIVADETGVGKPAIQEMQREWRGVRSIEGVIFNPKMKSTLRSIFEEYLYSDRIIIPSTPEVRATEKWQKWYLQMINLERVNKNGYIVFEKNRNHHSARDDYPDSFFLMLYAASLSLKSTRSVEVSDMSDVMQGLQSNVFDEFSLRIRKTMNNKSKLSLRDKRANKLLKGVLK